MHKYVSASLAVLAVVGVTLLNADDAQALDMSQLDGLKAQFLPPEYRNANFTLDDIKKIYREKCKTASGTDNSTLYKELEEGAETLMTCISSIANLTAIQGEIEAARPIGELDTVFHKYCTKAPVAEKCIKDFNAKVQPCLTEAERSQNGIMMRIGSSLLGFMCSKGGDQIALFVAEQGPECLEANKDAINTCANSSFSEFLPKDGTVPDAFNLPELVLAPKHCIDLERFEKCTLHHLEQCQEITPANVIESLFRFVKNETACKSWLETRATERAVFKTRNGAANDMSSTGTSMLSLIALTAVTTLAAR